MSDLIDEDLNGECFIVGASGEKEEWKNERIMYIVRNCPFNRGSIEVPGPDFDGADQSHTAWLDLLLRLNYHQQIEVLVPENPVPAAVNGVVGPRPVRVPDAQIAMKAMKVAYLRTMGLRMNLFHWNGTPAGHLTKYAEYRMFTWAQLQVWAREFFSDDTIAIDGLVSARLAIPRIPNFADAANVRWRNAVRPKIIDMVCMIAYFFRVRGHHWTQEMEARYSAVWRKAQYDEDNVGLDWQFVAHNAFHAIFPDDLDRIWIRAVNEEICAGALIKRIHSKPAGVAGISAMNAGVADLRMIVPRALDYAEAAVEHLDALNVIVDQHRWAGSVNRRFYGGPQVAVDETKLSALAAIILAGLDQLAPQSPLRNSKALQRIASNAAMTGAIVGRMVMRATNSDAAAEILLPAPVQQGAGQQRP